MSVSVVGPQSATEPAHDELVELYAAHRLADVAAATARTRWLAALNTIADPAARDEARRRAVLAAHGLPADDSVPSPR